MALLGDGTVSPRELLATNSPSSLTQLKKCILEQNLPPTDTAFVAETLCERLRPRSNNLDWSKNAETVTSTALQLEILVMLFESAAPESKLAILDSLSAYVNANVPWSNNTYSEISSSILKRDLASFVPEFMDLLKPRLLSVTDHRSARKNSKGLRPALGLRASAAAEETQRSSWKNSANICSLSSVVLLLAMEPHSSAVCSMFTSFTLNILDDSDPSFKAQGCQLLFQLLSRGGDTFLQKSGLLPTIRDSLTVCLTYLPQLTPAEVSIRLLRDGAYPALLQVMALDSNANYVSYLQLLDANVMGSISHVMGRNSDAATNELLQFFVLLMSKLVGQHLGLSVLVCLSRLNFMLNQLVTDPYLIDYDGGSSVVDAALGVQLTIMNQFLEAGSGSDKTHEETSEKAFENDRDEPDITEDNLDDSRQVSKSRDSSTSSGTSSAEALACFRPYVLDLLTAWAILAKRIVRFGVGSKNTKSAVSQNIRLLRDLSALTSEGQAEFDEHWLVLSENCPELRDVGTS